MNSYNVLITPDAEADLIEIDDYITLTLQAPDTAVYFLNTVKMRLLSLRNNPGRYRLIEDEPWHSMGIHRMNIKNFAVFYTIIENQNEVYIQNVIYQKRDLEHILREIYSDSEDN